MTGVYANEGGTRKTMTQTTADRLHCFLATALLLILFVPAAYALDVPERKGSVNDNAGMISAKMRDQLDGYLVSIEKSDSLRIFVLTVPSYEGETGEQFAEKVFSAWMPGPNALEKSLLIVVSQMEGNVQIMLSKGLAGVLETADKVSDSLELSLKRRDFDRGITEGIDALIGFVRGESATSKKQDKGGGLVGFWSRNAGKDDLLFFFFELFVVLYGVALVVGVFQRVASSKSAADNNGAARSGNIGVSGKRSGWIVSIIAGAICGAVVGFLQISETGPAAWIFYVGSGVLLGPIAKLAESVRGEGVGSGD